MSIRYGWQPRGDVLASQAGQCAEVLVYTVKLVKPGALIYTYQYTDENIIFQFQVKQVLYNIIVIINWELCSNNGRFMYTVLVICLFM